MSIESALYVVATPIGNLGDISQRAVDVLSKVDLVAAEDTRHTQRLLVHLGIDAQLISLHEHNERGKSESLVRRIEGGESIALVSDAGTPLISDPGYFFVKTARELGVKVVPIPGASALVTALSASGLASDRFVFEGFLPAKEGAKKKKLETFLTEKRTVIFYESPHRIVSTLESMAVVFGGERRVVMARELTKTFETILSLPVNELLGVVKADHHQQKGEFVLLVEGVLEQAIDRESINFDVEKSMAVLLKELPIKKAASVVAEMTGLPKKELYSLGLTIQGKKKVGIDKA